MEFAIYIIVALVCIGIGYFIGQAIQKSMATSKAHSIIENAEREADGIMKDKILEAKAESLRIQTDAERAANQRMQRVQNEENKIKQRQQQLNQQQSENARARNEIDAARQQLDNQAARLEQEHGELERMTRQARETLEHISGLSSEEAKEKLVESLKDEAKTQAASYINDIMDEAKLTANKEAKRIVVQSIQRLATETAIENSVWSRVHIPMHGQSKTRH